jgi:hypothetical protein
MYVKAFKINVIQSVPITTNNVSSSPVHVEVYSIQHYVIKFVSDCDGSVVLSVYNTIVIMYVKAFKINVIFISITS